MAKKKRGKEVLSGLSNAAQIAPYLNNLENYAPRTDVTLVDPSGKEMLLRAGEAKLLADPKAVAEGLRTGGDVEVRIVVKRQPTMADRLLASDTEGYPTSKKDERRVREYLLEAKRFVLDNEGAAYMADIVRENPKMIANNVEFAIPPFPTMYVEIPFLTFYKQVTGRDPDEAADATVGYLFKGPHVYVITDGRDASKPIIMPWYYRMNRPWTLQEEIEVAEDMGISRAQIDMFFWGESHDKLTENEQRIFRAHHSMWMMVPEMKESLFLKKMWKSVYDTSAGDLRNITALLLLLNRSGNVRYDVPLGPHRAMIHNKPRAFLSHSIIKFKLNPIKRVVNVGGTGMGAWRKEHDVRGHYCHDKLARAAQEPGQSCARDTYGMPIHDFHEYDVNQWACVKCKGKRWWRNACRRGTRDKGVVKTTYDVTE